MIEFIVALVFLLLALVALVLRKTYFYLPRKELQRQAARRDPLAATLWQAAAYGSSLQILLWICVGLGAAVGFVLFARIAPPIFGFVVVALGLWFGFAWMPSTRLTGWGARLAVSCTPAVVWLLGAMHPLFHKVAHYLAKFPIGPHTGVYERDDLLDLLARQKQQADNRMSVEELELAESALKFDDYKIRDVLVPRNQVTAIAMSEPIGPVLMDELHASKHVRFPVYADNKNDIIGTLFLRDIVDSKKGGTVADYADRHVVYAHENDSLSQALHAFRSAKQQILLVVNSSEEYIGIVTVSDVLSKLFTVRSSNDFVHHDDKKAVARKHDFVEQKPPEESTEEQPSQAPAATEADPVAETTPEVVK